MSYTPEDLKRYLNWLARAIESLESDAERSAELARRVGEAVGVEVRGKSAREAIAAVLRKLGEVLEEELRKLRK